MRQYAIQNNIFSFNLTCYSGFIEKTTGKIHFHRNEIVIQIFVLHYNYMTSLKQKSFLFTLYTQHIRQENLVNLLNLKLCDLYTKRHSDLATIRRRHQPFNICYVVEIRSQLFSYFPKSSLKKHKMEFVDHSIYSTDWAILQHQFYFKSLKIYKNLSGICQHLCNGIISPQSFR